MDRMALSWAASPSTPPQFGRALAATTTIFLLILSTTVLAHCECGYRISQTNALFTHRIYNNFSTFPDDPTPHLADWGIQVWSVAANATLGTVDRKNDPENVWLEGGRLHLRQRGHALADDGSVSRQPVSVAELHSYRNDIFHGSFRMRYTVEQEAEAKGGSVAGFFFYYNDGVESDIEVIVKDANQSATLMHYTNQPAFDLDQNYHVPNASYQAKLDRPWTEHKFDWTSDSVKFYQNNAMKQIISTNTPRNPGKIMINLWANNGTWSGPPSTKDVHMKVHYVNLYFNTTDSNLGNDDDFNERCKTARQSGRRSEAVCVIDDTKHTVDERIFGASDDKAEEVSGGGSGGGSGAPKALLLPWPFATAITTMAAVLWWACLWL